MNGLTDLHSRQFRSMNGLTDLHRRQSPISHMVFVDVKHHVYLLIFTEKGPLTAVSFLTNHGADPVTTPPTIGQVPHRLPIEATAGDSV